jgi:glycosyltransferase involved in cell wall biosynthesis
LKIAMMGTRGIPSSYGGFETFVEELGARLVQRGHQVTVYCRSHHIRTTERHYRGMDLVRLPTVGTKYTDTLVHTFLSTLHASLRNYDVVLICIVGNSPVSWIPRLTGKKVVLNVDGLDWQRLKWPGWAKQYIRFAEYLATVFPNTIVTDSRVIERYYQDAYGRPSACIAYGSDVKREPPGAHLRRFGLEPFKYVLFVGRLVPENRPEHLVQAFNGLDTDMKLVIVGDASYAEKYIGQLKAGAGPNVVFTGYLFGEGYRELSSSSYAFVETSEVGGTHPALIEAMAFGTCVVVNATPANLEVLGDAGMSYSGTVENLREVLQKLLTDPVMVRKFGQRAAERARERYSWKDVTNLYERLFRSLLA